MVATPVELTWDQVHLLAAEDAGAYLSPLRCGQAMGEGRVAPPQ